MKSPKETSSHLTYPKLINLPEEGILKLLDPNTGEWFQYISFKDHMLYDKDGSLISKKPFTYSELLCLFIITRERPCEFITSDVFEDDYGIQSARFHFYNIRKKLKEEVYSANITSGRNGYRFNANNAWSFSGNLNEAEEWDSRTKWAKDNWELPPLKDAALKKLLNNNYTLFTKFQTVIYLLTFLRRAEGSISKYELIDGIGQGDSNLIEDINSFLGAEILTEINSGTENPRFDKIVTSNQYRFLIDLMLDEYINYDKCDDICLYNPILYCNAFQKEKIGNKKITISFKPKGLFTELLDKILSGLNEASWQYKLFSTIKSRFLNYKKTYKVPNSIQPSLNFSNCYFDRDNISVLTNTLNGIQNDKKEIIGLDISDCFFADKLRIQNINITDGIDLSHTFFTDEVTIDGCYCTATNNAEPKYSFRESVFCANVYIKNNSFTLINDKKRFNNASFSFEDACFIKESDYGKANYDPDKDPELVLRNNDFRSMDISFFETIFNDYRVEISDCKLEDSSITMDHSVLLNRLVLVNNGNLGKLDFNFKKGNRLVMANLNITGILNISNIAQFELLNVTLFFGLIVSDPSWNFEENRDSVNIRKYDRYIDDSLYQTGDHPLLRASVNVKDKAKQFLILKECFHRNGDVVNENQAYRLYQACINSAEEKQLADPQEQTGISIIQATPSDHTLIKELASSCAPLDQHTGYTYWTLLRYNSDTCFIAYNDNTPIGFITGFCKEQTGFIWQIGVLPDYRKKGISGLLIATMVRRFKSLGASRIETTIDKSNKASYKAFQSYCKTNNIIMRAIADSNMYENEIIYEILLPL